jgi:TolB-like protein
MGADGRSAIYHFNGFTLDLPRAALLDPAGAEVSLRPKSFALLRHLVDNAGRLINRDEIMQAVWPDVVVTDDSITQCMKEIRRAIGDGEQRLLRTLPRRGYLLSASVTRGDAGFVVPPVQAASSMAADDDALPQPATGRPMVVVLPFENIGGEPAELYFADGLTADLITDLTRFQSLHVVSPARSRGNGQALPPEREALPRAAGYLLTGGVRRAGGRIRVTAQLESVTTGVILWANRFDRSLDDLFAVQDELAERIATVLAAHVDHEGLQRARRRPPASLDAYDLCLRGRELHGQGTEVATLAAREMFARAIAADPDYAPAHAWQAFTVQRAYTHRWGTPRGREALDTAFGHAHRAVSLEPDSSLCLVRLAFLMLLYEHRGEEAVAMARAAVEANPCELDTRPAFGEVVAHAGDPDTAVREVRATLALNPFSPLTTRAVLGRALLLAGHPEQALVELRRCVPQLQDYAPCHASMVVACVETGLMEEARAALRQVRRILPGWEPANFDGPWFFHRDVDAQRFFAAFSVAGEGGRV